MATTRTMRLDQAALIGVAALVVGYFLGLGSGFLILRAPVPAPGVSSGPVPPVAAPGSALGSASAEIKELTQIVARDPKNRPAWMRLGNLYFDSSQYMDAIQAYTKALELEPKDPDVITDRAVMYRSIGDFQRAASEFRRASELDPKHLNSLMNLGVVLRYDLNDAEGAIKAWQSYLDRNPPPDMAQRIRGELETLRQQRK
ncbi:MAG: tetratricopeptide repeat protein [Deltaproteobacteria bacterium]|nr:tetratricopeptide repeat protein [Deltaproteobacteria bacterium]